jgi:hypothetical protein
MGRVLVRSLDEPDDVGRHVLKGLDGDRELFVVGSRVADRT